ncbi:hypothetical protein BD769DRAFT_1442597 [Suillus cothurnatus]|nr:hypothetical protein BD769DRAFT_1442597 [Suillus cothurnatus]
MRSARRRARHMSFSLLSWWGGVKCLDDELCVKRGVCLLACALATWLSCRVSANNDHLAHPSCVYDSRHNFILSSICIEVMNSVEQAGLSSGSYPPLLRG